VQNSSNHFILSDMTERLEQLIASLRPALMMQGRDIALAEASETKIAISLTGFCGGCGCSSEYVDGLREMLQQEFPTTQIEVNAV